MRKNKVQDNLEYSSNLQEQHVQILCNAVSANHYRVFLDTDIEEPSKYRDLIQVLLEASENDCVEFLISCDGGQLDSTIDITNAIRASQAYTRAVVTSKAHSGGSFIAVACDDLVALPHSVMLLHQPRGGTSGRHQELLTEIKFEEPWIAGFYKDLYKDFLTDAEIKDILNGKDIRLNSTQINTRAQKRVKAQQKENQRILQEMKKSKKSS